MATLRGVKKLSKVILLAAAGLVALALVALFSINLYIQSHGAHARIQAGLSAALRVPLRFTTTSLSPWGHLKITGISVPDGDRNFLEAGAFHAHCRMLPLLRGRLEIYEMTVETPKIIWVQNATGTWDMPQLAPAEPAQEKRKEEPQGGKKRDGFEVVVGSFEMRGGSAELLDKQQQPVATFSGVNVRCSTLTAARVEGLAQIARLVWGDALTFENLRAPFSYTAQGLTLPEFTGVLAGGRMTGNFALHPDPWMSPFEVALNFSDVKAGPLSKQFASSSGLASGTLAGTLSLHGSSKRISRAEGSGTLRILDGRFQQLELFEAIGTALDIRELSDLRLKDGRAEFHIAKERVTVDALSLEAADLQLGAKGTIRFDGKIQLDSELSLDEELYRQLPAIVRNNLVTDAGSRHAIAFEIKGDHFKARSNLGDNIFGKKIANDLQDLASTIFGTKKKEEKDKKKKPKESAALRDALPEAAP